MKNKKDNRKIDFVILWVNGADPEWRALKERWQPERVKDNSADANRFRDWDLMRYWFRGVEKFAPWVNHIYFVTSCKVPEWLNTEHEKLTVVNHRDFMPEDCLPTFNSNAIEMHLHRIPGISEQFVSFNDDMFLSAPVKKSDFFRHGLPMECALLDAPAPDYIRNILPHTLLNNAAVINTYFNKKQVLKKHFFKFYNLKYGKNLIRNILLTPTRYFSCFRSPHNPVSHLKSTYETLWELEPEMLDATSHHRFRSTQDVTHWLMKDYRLCKGEFIPRSTEFNHCYELGIDDIEVICRSILSGRYKALCLNDSYDIFSDETMNRMKKMLQDSWNRVLPDSSSYERM